MAYARDTAYDSHASGHVAEGTLGREWAGRHRGMIMLQVNRRTSLKLIGGAALAAGALPLPAFAQGTDLVVPNKYRKFQARHDPQHAS